MFTFILIISILIFIIYKLKIKIQNLEYNQTKLQKNIETYCITKKYNIENELRLKSSVQNMKKQLIKLNKLYKIEFEKIEMENIRIYKYLQIKSSNYFSKYIPLNNIFTNQSEYIRQWRNNNKYDSDLLLYRSDCQSINIPANNHYKKIWETNFYKYFNKQNQFLYNNKNYDCELEIVKCMTRDGGRPYTSRNIICKIDNFYYTIGRIITSVDSSTSGCDYSSVFEFNKLIIKHF